MDKIAILALIMSLSACGGWKSSFTEQELSDALYERITGPRGWCTDKCAEEIKNTFSLKLIECNPEVPPMSGLSGPDLRSAETCLVEYTVGGEVITRESWVFYRIDGNPIAYKHL